MNKKRIKMKFDILRKLINLAPNNKVARSFLNFIADDTIEFTKTWGELEKADKELAVETERLILTLYDNFTLAVSQALRELEAGLVEGEEEKHG